MAPDQIAPKLSEHDYTTINVQLTRLARTLDDIAVAKKAGFSCDEHQQLCDSLIAAYKRVKQAYFPERP